MQDVLDIHVGENEGVILFYNKHCLMVSIEIIIKKQLERHQKWEAEAMMFMLCRECCIVEILI